MEQSQAKIGFEIDLRPIIFVHPTKLTLEEKILVTGPYKKGPLAKIGLETGPNHHLRNSTGQAQQDKDSVEHTPTELTSNRPAAIPGK